MKILVVEDEQDIRSLVTYNLEKQGYAVDEARDGEEALGFLREGGYRLVVLDLMLPGLSGLEICGIMKRNPKTAAIPIIMLTARSEETDKVSGLDSGADDYITKPFSIKEFTARVTAVLRRVDGRKEERKQITAGTITMDLEKHKVSAGGMDLDLSSTEFDLLQMLMGRRGRVFSRDQILDSVWKGEAFVESRTVDVHIRRLRAELERADASHCIETVRGAGYRFREED